MGKIISKLSVFTKKESHYSGSRRTSDGWIYHGHDIYFTIVYTSGTLDKLKKNQIKKLKKYFSEIKMDVIEDEFYGSPTVEVFDEGKTDNLISILNFILPDSFEKSSVKFPICINIEDFKLIYTIVIDEFMSVKFDNRYRLSLIANLVKNNQIIQNEIIDKWLRQDNFSSNEELLEYVERIKELKIEIKVKPLPNSKMSNNNYSNNGSDTSWEEVGRDELRGWDESFHGWRGNID